MNEKMVYSLNMDAAMNIPAETLQMMYGTMLRIRKFEERVAELVSKNEIICPCHLYIGEEAVATGVCSALRKDGWFFSTHRSNMNHWGWDISIFLKTEQISNEVLSLPMYPEKHQLLRRKLK